MLQYSKLQMAKTVVKISVVRVYNSYLVLVFLVIARYALAISIHKYATKSKQVYRKLKVDVVIV